MLACLATLLTALLVFRPLQALGACAVDLQGDGEGEAECNEGGGARVSVRGTWALRGADGCSMRCLAAEGDLVVTCGPEQQLRQWRVHLDAPWRGGAEVAASEVISLCTTRQVDVQHPQALCFLGEGASTVVVAGCGTQVLCLDGSPSEDAGGLA
eukprot:2746670-Pleurochrysis_carterae.AAC.2